MTTMRFDLFSFEAYHVYVKRKHVTPSVIHEEDAFLPLLNN